MSIRNDIEEGNLDRLKDTARKVSQAYRSGFGRCIVCRVEALDLTQSAEALQNLLSEEGIECFVDSLHHLDPALPDRKGVWIIDNADALNDFATSAWLKTALDILQPSLRIIVVTDTDAPRLTEQRLSLLGALSM